MNRTIGFSEALKPANIDLIRRLLQADGLIVYPTDTLYGLGGNFLSPVLIEKIDTVKGRADLPYSVAVSGLPMIETLTAAIPPIFTEIYRQLLPGKFTFLLPAAPGLDRKLLKNSDKIGIRIPALPGLLQLIDLLGFPLLTTSVNRSGQTPLQDPDSIRRAFAQVDILLDAGVLPPSPGSTIIDLTASPPRVTRRGEDFEKLTALGFTFRV